MTSDKLENLVRIGKLKREPPSASELAGLKRCSSRPWDSPLLGLRDVSLPAKRSGLSRLADAECSDLSFESRFDLAYNAAHALALYALRRMGYRSENRYLVFQALPHTAGLAVGHSRVLAKAHEKRNLAEYEGYLDQDERLLADVLAATRALIDALAGDERQ
ncbi:MAG: hypothetical protein ACREVJ_00615 [Gammaproteobacteria bacterium]